MHFSISHIEWTQRNVFIFYISFPPFTLNNIKLWYDCGSLRHSAMVLSISLIFHSSFLISDAQWHHQGPVLCFSSKRSHPFVWYKTAQYFKENINTTKLHVPGCRILVFVSHFLISLIKTLLITRTCLVSPYLHKYQLRFPGYWSWRAFLRCWWRF